VKKPHGYWLAFFLLLAFAPGALSAQEGFTPEANSPQSEPSQSRPPETAQTWPDELKQLETLLDNWARDSEEQARELEKLKATADSLNLLLTNSDQALSAAMKSVTFWKNLAEAEQRERTRAQAQTRTYKWTAVATAVIAIIGWGAFVIASR
jgi:hypothetical protein